ncbi:MULTISPECIES: hypothetical protein [unclassified Chryseobacterium]|uniref:hypothetical protein n=1 Tax=unclassified Chryseobacterium TaxID=2593645 RepID=UPI002269FC57|nr:MULTISPECIES: hypothetical protein [unclassified Chryseobacterium]
MKFCIFEIISSSFNISFVNIQHLIDEYISHQPEQKRINLQHLHQIMLEIMPNCKLWFLDGKNVTGDCIKFKSLKNINIEVLKDAIQSAL